ncbi:polysaccharide deacetylase family protein [Streptomyces sp. NRRL F-5135]|uniref:polysaccharide deacetylase family protein n=1 Tax=Streptomyces sp. NRRL F-5135 TaxID=1463858 RepID=UPI00068B0723|nr:polysaccharide deacetylase family protein [Streptomyces sp. NRRL F-5135]
MRAPDASARALRTPGAIPVLLYHAVMDDPPSWIAEFTVTPRDFAAHLDAIVAGGRTPITVSTLADHLPAASPGHRTHRPTTFPSAPEASPSASLSASPPPPPSTPAPPPAPAPPVAPLPPRPVVLTFDDGFADLPGPTAEALAARALPATAYLTTGAITPGRTSLLPPAPMMRLAQAPALESYGMEVGAHTVTHPPLDTLRPAALLGELRASKQALEDTLGHEVAHLAYPHGYNSRAVRRAAASAGYSSAVAVRHALSSAHDEPYRIARLIVRRRHTVADVEAWMAGAPARGERARVAPFPDSPATLGWRLYRSARARVRGPEFAG